MSLITCIIGGRVRVMFCRKPCVAPLPLPPSHTTTLSNLMFEIALAAVFGQGVEVLEHQQLERLLRAPPHASTISLRPSPFLARISYWPRASASSLA
jgi:hypothetical protein